MNNKTILNIAVYSLIAFFLSYYVFMGFQACLTLVSKQGTAFLEEIGATLMCFELVSLAVYLYRYMFTTPKNLKKFYKSNGLFHVIYGGLCFCIMIYETITYKNWSIGGATIAYPIDFLLLSAICIFAGIYSIVLSIKSELVLNAPKVKQNGAFTIWKIIMYIWIFIAMDRLGAFIVSFLNFGTTDFVVLVPIYIQCLIPATCTILYLVYHQVKVIKKPKLLWLIASISMLCLAIGCTIYCIAMLNGQDAAEFIKISSVFYGFDRLITFPVTFILICLLSIACPLIAFILYFVKQCKNKQA